RTSAETREEVCRARQPIWPSPRRRAIVSAHPAFDANPREAMRLSSLSVRVQRSLLGHSELTPLPLADVRLPDQTSSAAGALQQLSRAPRNGPAPAGWLVCIARWHPVDA